MIARVLRARRYAPHGDPNPFLDRRRETTGCPNPFTVGIAQLPIDALSELASGRVAKGREGPNTTELESAANPFPTPKGSGHPRSGQTQASHHKLPIDALSELASGRVAEGREGPKTTQLKSTANPIPTLTGAGAESPAKKEVAW